MYRAKIEVRLIKVRSHKAKANAESEKIKELSKEIKENISNTKENFRFRIRFRLVWTDPNTAADPGRGVHPCQNSLLTPVHTKRKWKLKRKISKINEKISNGKEKFRFCFRFRFSFCSVWMGPYKNGHLRQPNRFHVFMCLDSPLPPSIYLPARFTTTYINKVQVE